MCSDKAGGRGWRGSISLDRSLRDDELLPVDSQHVKMNVVLVQGAMSNLLILSSVMKHNILRQTQFFSSQNIKHESV